MKGLFYLTFIMMQKKYFEYFLLFSLSFIPFIPELGVIDIIGIHNLYLALTQGFISFYLLRFRRTELSAISFFDNPILISFSLFLIFSTFSIFFAFNKTESLIEIFRQISIFIALINFYVLFQLDSNYKRSFSLIFLILLSVESLYIFSIFLENYSFENPPSRLREFQGFSYNQNIASFSILIKLPIAIYVVLISKNRLLKLVLISLISITFFNILIIGSRGAIMMSFFLYFILFFLFIAPKRILLLSSKKTLFILLLALFVTGLSQNALYKNRNELKSIERVTNLAGEFSFNYRLDNYKEALQGISEKPIFGFGIGNWKIFSIKYAKSRIKGYTVPYHVHNDFLQVFVESGFFAFIFFLGIFVIPLFFLTIKIIRNQSEDYLFNFFIIISILIYCADSFINFPKGRVYSQMNFIYLFSITSFLINQKSTFKYKINLKQALIFLLIISPLNIYLSYRVFRSYQNQKYLISDFNLNYEDPKTPLDLVETFDTEIPNLTVSTLPIVQAKIQYYLKYGLIEKALQAAIQGSKDNPFLGIMEHTMAKVYLKHNKNIDSAYKYAKLSNQRIEKNNAHASVLQMVLNELNKFDEFKELFLKVKHMKDPIVWKNFFILNTRFKLNNGIEFDEFDKSTISEALILFPDEGFYNRMDKIMNYSDEIIGKVNFIDAQAHINFKNKNYLDAISEWKEASALIPDENSYYLNIASCFLRLNEGVEGNKFLNKIDSLNIKSNSGKYEFLKGLYFLGEKNRLKSCEFFNKANALGNYDAPFALKTLGCK
tara:strand:- start:870 stop:3194 length:2325 start_codon:yes stop_codon:yes gene_type:complete